MLSGLILAGVSLLYQIYRGTVRGTDILIDVPVTALVWSILSYVLSRTYRHFKLSPRYELLVIPSAIFGLLGVLGLVALVGYMIFFPPSSSTAQTGTIPTQITQPTEAAYPTGTPEANSDICQWFIKTQFLRLERMGGLSEFNEWYQKHGTEGFVSSDDSVIEELVTVLKRYQPYQEQFLEDWIELGAHPEAQEFWEKELSAVQLRIQAFDQMIKGVEEKNTDKYNDGLTTSSKASQVGLEAESAMLVVRSKCVP